jgi:hypothetical protein
LEPGLCVCGIHTLPLSYTLSSLNAFFLSWNSYILGAKFYFSVKVETENSLCLKSNLKRTFSGK